MAANRQRTSSNAGEKALKALHVLRQSGVGTVQAARLDAVSKSLALGDPTDKSPFDVVGRLTLDAETARRLVDAIRTTPPPLSDADADDFGQRRARNAPRRACDAGWSLLEFARRGACDGASLLLEAGFVPAAVAAPVSNPPPLLRSRESCVRWKFPAPSRTCGATRRSRGSSNS